MTTSRITFERTVHIEGMDLAGKSTATAGLAALRPTARLRRNSLTDTNPIYELADSLRRAGAVSARVLGRLYIAALAEDLEKTDDADIETIQDSTILLRSLAYNTAIEESEIVAELLRFVDVHPRYGTSITLTATIDARLERLEQRRREAPEEVAPDDLLIIRAPSLFARMESELIRYSVDYFDARVIDTSNLKPKEVLDAVIDLSA